MGFVTLDESVVFKKVYVKPLDYRIALQNISRYFICFNIIDVVIVLLGEPTSLDVRRGFVKGWLPKGIRLKCFGKIDNDMTLNVLGALGFFTGERDWLTSGRG